MGWLFVIVVGFLVSMLRAKVVTIMWGWFLVPLGLPVLPFGVALGCMFTWNIINNPSWEDLKERDLSERFIYIVAAIMQAVVTLGFGWLIKSAIGVQ